MDFNKPVFLLMLIVLVPVITVLYIGFRRGLNDLKILGGVHRYESIRNVYTVKSFLSGLLFILFVVSAIFALADIRWGERIIQEKKKGYEIVILIDDSRSMLVRDISPSRLKKSISVAKDVIREIKDGIFGLVLFKGDAEESMPVTDDTVSLTAILNAVQPDWITSPGTDIEKGLKKAYQVFSGTSDSNKVILLFSDGENQNGDPVRYAKYLGKIGIPVICLGAGTQTGGVIKLSNGETVKDRKGMEVLSRLHKKILENIAEVSGGSYIEMYRTNNILQRIVREFTRIKKGKYGSGFRVVKRERYGLLLLFSVIFLSLSGLIWKVRWKNTL